MQQKSCNFQNTYDALLMIQLRRKMPTLIHYLKENPTDSKSNTLLRYIELLMKECAAYRQKNEMIIPYPNIEVQQALDTIPKNSCEFDYILYGACTSEYSAMSMKQEWDEHLQTIEEKIKEEKRARKLLLSSL